LEVKVAGA